VIAALVVPLILLGAGGPALPAAGAAWPLQGRETITAIQIHGNTVTSDDEIRRLAGVEIGAALDGGTMDEVAARLRATRRFESVQVLKRYASIADPSQILVVIIVDEGPVQIQMTGDPANPTRVVRNTRPRLMFLPILSAEDGYGVTYGARIALPDPIGKGSRLAVPLSWGGDKRAGAEVEKSFEHEPIDRLLAGASVSRRTNPFFNAEDDRAQVWVRGERRFARVIRVGAATGWQRVSFLEAVDRFAYAGADVVLDTRADPVLPRNGVYARAAWEHAAGANRSDLDASGYLGLLGQTIVAVRAQRSDSDRSLPPFLKPLLGGMTNLRGFAAGTEAGDTLVATSAELIVPLTSPLQVGHVGVSAFVDSGTAYDKGQRLAEQVWKRGVGGSVWFSAAFFRLNVAVAHGVGSSTRVHVGANVSF
jgi:outer membrane protein assembly factor BamA